MVFNQKKAINAAIIRKSITLLEPDKKTIESILNNTNNKILPDGLKFDAARYINVKKNSINPKVVGSEVRL